MKTSSRNQKYAVITGASCGIGEAFAREFASRGYHLLITGRRALVLSRLARELRKKYQVRVITLVIDFTIKRDLNQLLDAIDRLESIEVLVNNAGFGCSKQFFTDTFRNQEKMLQVHINVTSNITHRVVPKLLENKGGYIINVSSLAAFIPLPNNYFYSASKAFLTTFSECLHLALHDKNILVQALCPGFTLTEFHKKIGKAPEGMTKRRRILWMTAESVVSKSIRALDKKRKVICIPGFLNTMIFNIVRVLPRNFYYMIANNLPAA